MVAKKVGPLPYCLSNLEMPPFRCRQSLIMLSWINSICGKANPAGLIWLGLNAAENERSSSELRGVSHRHYSAKLGRKRPTSRDETRRSLTDLAVLILCSKGLKTTEIHGNDRNRWNVRTPRHC